MVLPFRRKEKGAVSPRTHTVAFGFAAIVDVALEQFLLELLQEPDSGIVLSFLLLFCPSSSLEMSRNGRGTTLSIVGRGAERLSPLLLVGLEIPPN